MAIELIGQRFGMVTVLFFNGSENNNRIWKCICDCGNVVKKTTKQLHGGKSDSCGCLQKNILSQRNKNNALHGLSRHPIYKVWSSMMHRCYSEIDKSYNDYGGRGIIVCERWHKFENFYEDVVGGYKKGLQIDRENVNGNYELSNFRWATTIEQARNKRNNIYIEYEGEVYFMSDLAKQFNILPETVNSRLKRSYSIKDALTLPIHQGKKH